MQGLRVIHFRGGVLDGTVHDNFPPQLSGKPVHARRGAVAVKVTGGVEILRLPDDKPLPLNWMSYNVDVYLPTGRTDKDKGLEYQFSGTSGVNRCESLTLKKKQCRNQAVDGSDYCKAHLPR